MLRKCLLLIGTLAVAACQPSSPAAVLASPGVTPSPGSSPESSPTPPPPTQAPTPQPTPTPGGGGSGEFLYVEDTLEGPAVVSATRGALIVLTAASIEQIAGHPFDGRVDVTISPDGTRLLIDLSTCTADSGCHEYHVSTIDLAEHVPLPVEANWAWSPDGTRLAGTQIGADGWRRAAWLANADGTGLMRLDAAGARRDSDLSWSLDGARILYSKDGALASLDVATLQNTSIDLPDPMSEVFLRALQFSPDSRWVALLTFDSTDPDPAAQVLYVVASDLSRLAYAVPFRGELSDADLRWSPDSQQIVVTHYDSEGSATSVVLDAETGADLGIVVPRGGRPCGWTPDGRLLLVRVSPSLQGWPALTSNGVVYGSATLPRGLYAISTYPPVGEATPIANMGNRSSCPVWLEVPQVSARPLVGLALGVSEPALPLPVYDSFEGTELDTSRWFLSDPGSPVYLYNGALHMRLNSPEASADLGLRTVTSATIAEDPIDFEADFAILSMPVREAALAYGHIAAVMGNMDFQASCQLNANNESPGATPWIYCYVAREDEELYGSDYVMWRYAEPVAIRIEYDPRAGAFRFFGNGFLLGEYAPEHLPAEASRMSFTIAGFANPSTEFSAEVAEVRLTE